jgi:hypothetical protein
MSSDTTDMTVTSLTPLEATLRSSPLFQQVDDTWAEYAAALERARSAPPEEGRERAEAEAQEAWQRHREVTDAFWESFYRHLLAAAPVPATVPRLAQTRPRHPATVRGN